MHELPPRLSDFIPGSMTPWSTCTSKSLKLRCWPRHAGLPNMACPCRVFRGRDHNWRNMVLGISRFHFTVSCLHCIGTALLQKDVVARQLELILQGATTPSLPRDLFSDV